MINRPVVKEQESGEARISTQGCLMQSLAFPAPPRGSWLPLKKSSTEYLLLIARKNMKRSKEESLSSTANRKEIQGDQENAPGKQRQHGGQGGRG